MSSALQPGCMQHKQTYAFDANVAHEPVRALTVEGGAQRPGGILVLLPTYLYFNRHARTAYPAWNTCPASAACTSALAAVQEQCSSQWQRARQGSDGCPRKRLKKIKSWDRQATSTTACAGITAVGNNSMQGHRHASSYLGGCQSPRPWAGSQVAILPQHPHHHLRHNMQARVHARREATIHQHPCCCTQLLFCPIPSTCRNS